MNKSFLYTAVFIGLVLSTGNFQVASAQQKSFSEQPGNMALRTPRSGPGKTVILDSYFNNETKKDQNGNLVRWHYKWNDKSDGGFSIWGSQFTAAGFKTSTLYTRPTVLDLKKGAVYIIVDPDTEKENDKPNFINDSDIWEIRSWVKSGGVLLLMANDVGNAELDHFNELVSAFGIQFNKDSKGKVTGDQFDMGKIIIGNDNPVFKTARKVYIKEFTSLKLSPKATSVLKDKDNNEVVALTHYGKGTVLVIGDPWVYNEYMNGRLPAGYDNFKAGADLGGMDCQFKSTK